MLVSRIPYIIFILPAVALGAWVARLVVRAFFIAHVRGNGVLVSASQLPYILESVQKACSQFGISLPEIYVVQFGKLRQTLVEFFLSSKILVLSSQLVKECGQGPRLDFHVGREIGHIALQHHWWHFILAPSAIVPLAYAAWRRATEYSADLCGAAICGGMQPAQGAMFISAVGSFAGKVHLPAYHADLPGSGGFWMTLRQLRSYYPDVNWRVARLANAADASPTAGPRRSVFATVLCSLMPAINPQIKSVGGTLATVLAISFLVSMLVSILLPSLVMMRQQAKGSIMAVRLKAYSQAIQAYMAENKGYLPPDLTALENNVYIVDRSPQDESLQYVPRQPCEIFRITSSPASVVVIFCEDRTTCVAGFLDGHIELMSRAQLARALAYSLEVFNGVSPSADWKRPEGPRRRSDHESAGP